MIASVRPDAATPGRLPLAKEKVLSAREEEILGCLVRGSSNKEIARNLAVAEATVKVHLKAILRKIQVKNRTQAAIWAVNHLTDGKPQEGEPQRVNNGSAVQRNGGMN